MTPNSNHEWSKRSVLQASLMIVLVFGDIGFDHQGKFGLSFETLILCGAALTLSSLIGTFQNARKKAWGATLVQLSLPFVAFSGLILMEALYARLQ